MLAQCTWWPDSHMRLRLRVARHGLALWAEGCTLSCDGGLRSSS